jgi:ribosomal protein S6--L-glutamate ligase
VRGTGLTIGVLGNAADPSTLAIARELESLGAEAPIIDLNDTSIINGAVRWNDRKLPHLDGAVAYHGALVPKNGMKAMQTLERNGVTFINPTTSIRISRDKWTAADALQNAGVSTPRTRLLRNSSDVKAAVEALGSPTVFKLRVGTEGRGVYKVTDPSEAVPIAETVFATRRNLVAQEMVDVERPSDVRAFVVGDRVVASMKRTAPVQHGANKDFRANVSNGGTAEPIDLHPEDANTAIAAARAMGLDVAGIDLMGAPGAMQVIEANSGPGQKIAQVTGVNVGGAIAEYAIDKVRESASLVTARASGAPATAQAREGVRLLITAVDRNKELSEAPRYLQQRAEEAGHTADIVRIYDITSDGNGGFLHKGKPFDLDQYDGVIVRGGAEHAESDLATLRAIEKTGIPTINPPNFIETAGNKWKTARALEHAGVPHPKTMNIVAGTSEEITAQVDRILDEYGPTKLVIKPASDLGGAGVIFWPGSPRRSGEMALPDRNVARLSLRSIVDSQLPNTRNGLVVQPWILESGGLDTRAFVVKNTEGTYDIVGSYQRTPPDGVGAANLSKGATIKPVVPDSELRALTQRAAAAVGLQNGAIDFIHRNDGWKVVEVNSSAGVRPGTEQDAGGDVAGAVIAQAVAAARAHRGG